jgi:hypothetical protein
MTFPPPYTLLPFLSPESRATAVAETKDANHYNLSFPFSCLTITCNHHKFQTIEVLMNP